MALTALLLLAALSQPVQQTAGKGLEVVAELECLRVALALQIGREQAPAVLKALQNVSEQQAAYARWAEEQWKASGEAVQAAVEAWVGGRQPTAEQAQAAHALQAAAEEKRRGLQAAAAAAAGAVRRALGDQAGLAEDEETARQRALGERRFHGARHAAEAVLMAAESLHLLMPDDYALVRVSEAEAIAQAMVGGAGRPSPQAVQAVLAVLDDLQEVPAQSFTRQRAQLLASIAQRLGLPAEEAHLPPVSWEELLRWVQAPQTAAVVGLLAGQTAAAAPQPPPALQAALEQLDLLAMMAELQLTAEQREALGGLLTRVARDAAAAERARARLGERAGDLLAKARASLAAGQALPAETADALQAVLAEADEIRAQLEAAMIEHLDNFRRLLGPAQRELVDWTPPGRVLREVPPEERARDLRRRASLLTEAIDFLDSIKYQPAHHYANVKVQYTQKFVSQFVDPESPQFEAAMTMALDTVTEARFVDREDWEKGTKVEFATHLLQGLGALEPPGLPPPGQRVLYTWQQLYDLFTSPGVVKLAEGRRGGGQQ
jgi:hypothetical protein